MLHAVRSILKEDASVYALVGERITTATRPQGQQLPAILLETDSIETNESKTSTSGLDEVRFTLTTFDDSYEGAYTLDILSRAALDLFIGDIGTPSVAFNEIRYSSSNEDYFNTAETGVYHRSMSFTAYVKMTAGGASYPAGVNAPVTVENSDGTYSDSEAAGGTHVVPDFILTNSDNSYSNSRVSGVDQEIPDTTIKRTLGDGSIETWFVEPSSDPSGKTLPGQRLYDKNALAVGSFAAGKQVHIMADYDSGDVVEDSTKVTITPPTGVIPSGRLYFPPPISQRTSYENFDEGWQAQNGTYTYTPPATAEKYMLLDTDHATPGERLNDTNEFDNLYRFTDDAGTQSYTDPLIIDHHTGLMFLDVLQGPTNWATQLSNANSLTAYTFTDWRLANMAELQSVFNQETAGWYSPFTAIGGNTLWTATIYSADTTKAQTMWSYTNFSRLSRTGNYRGLYVRNHYV